MKYRDADIDKVIELAGLRLFDADDEIRSLADRALVRRRYHDWAAQHLVDVLTGPGGRQ